MKASDGQAKRCTGIIENMDVIKYLSGYGKAAAKQEVFRVQFDILKTLSGDEASRRAALKQLKREYRKQEQIKSEIKAKIDALDNELLRRVLTLRYIDGLMWQELAWELDVSVSKAYKLHRQALTEVKV